jgi:hypothetical protein
MITVAFFGLAILGLFAGPTWLAMLPVGLASFYATLLLPGTLNGGKELNKEQLREALERDWREPEKMTKVITRNWFSIKYIMSSQARKRSCVIVGLGSIALSVGYLALPNPHPLWLITWSALNAAILILIGGRVANAISALKKHGTPEWRLACVSFVALSDMMDNDNFRFIVEQTLPRELVTSAITIHAKDPEKIITHHGL